MHDYYAVSTLIARLTREPGLTEGVIEVRVLASPLFSPEALQQTYEMLTEETPLAGSCLIVEDLVDCRECAACEATWALSHEDVAGHLVVCPSCGTLSALEGGAGIELLEIRREEAVTTHSLDAFVTERTARRVFYPKT